MNLSRPAVTDAEVEVAARPGESRDQARTRLARWRSWPRVMLPCVHNPVDCTGFIEVGRDGDECAGCHDGAIYIDTGLRAEDELADAMPALIASGEWARRVEEARAAADADPIPF